ncbi:ankyrin repeat containing protein [Colletotrichum truncatum]|uniref:Ankyrin repeat containing protein n=1 Tax=Colletotrichum truncatum TaxID=5467 RepID=A0ACC3YC92_COLTU
METRATGDTILVKLADVKNASFEVKLFFANLECQSEARKARLQQLLRRDVTFPTSGLPPDDNSQLELLVELATTVLDAIHKRLIILSNETPLWVPTLFPEFVKVTAALEAVIKRSAVSSDEDERAICEGPVEKPSGDSTEIEGLALEEGFKRVPALLNSDGPDSPHTQNLPLPPTAEIQQLAEANNRQRSHQRKYGASKILPNDPSKNDRPDQAVRTAARPVDVEKLESLTTRTFPVFPELTGPIHAQLGRLVTFSKTHWPERDLDQFLPNKKMQRWVLDEILRQGLGSDYALDVSPVNSTNLRRKGIVVPYHVNSENQLSEVEERKDHFVIAIVDLEKKAFTAWGMSKEMFHKSKSEYEGFLGSLSGQSNNLEDYSGNCCLLRCVEAVRSYFKIGSIIQDHLQLRLFFLKELVESWINTNNQGASQRLESKNLDFAKNPSEASVDSVMADGYVPNNPLNPVQPVDRTPSASDSLTTGKGDMNEANSPCHSMTLSCFPCRPPNAPRRASKRPATNELFQRPIKAHKQDVNPEGLANQLLDEKAYLKFMGHVSTYSRIFGSKNEAENLVNGFKITRCDDSLESRAAEVAQYIKVGSDLDGNAHFYMWLSRVALIISVRKLDEAVAALGYQTLPANYMDDLERLLGCFGSTIAKGTLKNKLGKSRLWIKTLGEFQGLLAFVNIFAPYEKLSQDDAKQVACCLRRKKMMASYLHTQGQQLFDCIVNGREYRPTDAGVPRPQLQLVTQITVPDTALSITYAMEGNIDGLQELFGKGLATPYDVSISRRYSLIRWALYGGMHQYETVRFLINAKAPVDEESYKHVWDFSFRKKCTDEEFTHLSCIRTYSDRDWIEDQKFPLIHKIIFGLDSKSLMAELLENPEAVELKDNEGRTALDWATARAQLDDMRLLIQFGSSLNTMDIKGRTTVQHAVDSHSDMALEMVLKAGANPNPPDSMYRSSPLTSASFGGLENMARLLLEFGAKVGSCNPEGRTALHTVAKSQHLGCAVVLLRHGAKLDDCSSIGHTPLATSIIHNKHNILRLFVEECKKYSCFQGPPLLPIIAKYADEETISILASSEPFLKLLSLSCNEFKREILWARET